MFSIIHKFQMSLVGKDARTLKSQLIVSKLYYVPQKLRNSIILGTGNDKQMTRHYLC